MKTFIPIAIIGQGCILPGCKTPGEVWDTVSNGRVHITHPIRRDWRTHIQGHVDGSILGKIVTDKGGYVDDKDCLPYSEMMKDLDPLFKWCVYAAQQALLDSGYQESDCLNKTGLILGNLSFPSDSFSQLFENGMLAETYPSNYKNIDPRNRFVSGLPALYTKKFFSLGGEAFSLDAACASSLYAVKLACDRLRNGSADMMLAGAVNAAEQLFLHVGFTCLEALSPTGESRPFSQKADGLLPAEGATFLVLKRVDDAIRDGDWIQGIIRGIYCSNNGGGSGLLAPSMEDQIFCMTQAYKVAGVNPEDVSYVECHATGTSIGDTAELKGLKEVFKHNSMLYLGSLKANFGHLITTAGAASFIKVLQSLKHQQISPTPNSRPFNTEIENSIFRIPQSTEPWKRKDPVKPLLAAISNFGFGGNNAHAIIEEWTLHSAKKYQTNHLKPKKNKPKKAALIALEIELNNITSAAELLTCLKNKNDPSAKLDQPYKPEIVLDQNSLGFPPNDLKETLGQQLMVLKKAREALAGVNHIDPKTTGVYIGMGTDVEVNRFGLNMRLKKLLRQHSPGISEHTLDKIIQNNDRPTAAASLGCMPNITANRVSNQYNLKGPCFTISCEELSGNKALECALLAIANGEINTAIVGAVDLSMHPVHIKATTDVLGDHYSKGSNCVILYVLKEVDLALKDKEKIIATLELPAKSRENPAPPSPQSEKDIDELIQAVGVPFAAHGLLKFTSHLLLSRNTRAQVTIRESFIGETSSINMVKHLRDLPYDMALFSGLDQPDLLNNLNANIPHDPQAHQHHNTRLGFLFSSPQEYDLSLQNAITQVSKNDTKQAGWNEGIVIYPNSPEGDLAFAFTGAASAYKGMGRELLAQYPNLEKQLRQKWSNADKVKDWIYNDPKETAGENVPFNQLCSSTFLSQIHAIWTQEILGIHPDAVLGLSSGETNSILAMGVWQDFDALFSEIYDSDLYHSQLSGEYQSVKQYWGITENLVWDNMILLHPIDRVREKLEHHKKVFLCIINSPSSCVVGGEKEALNAFIDDLGRPLSVPLNHDLAIHCPVVKPFESKWYSLHHRKATPNSKVKFYSNVFGGVYEPTADRVAEALTVQAIQMIDFPRIVEKAWEDGARIFIEHGPKNSLSKSISEILQGKDHITIALDHGSTSSFTQILLSSLEIWALGYNIDLTNLPVKHIDSPPGKFHMTFQLYKPAFYLPDQGYTVMPKPPVLAPVLNTKKPKPITTPFALDDKKQLILEIQKERDRIHNLYLEKSKQSHLQYMSSLQNLLVSLGAPKETASEKEGLPGLKISRKELEILASDNISKIFGPQFQVFDDFDLLVRMPMPPLLLCDRVTVINAKPMLLGQGTIWTETDVREDSWYLHHGHMPAGVYIESGQADLLLISYMGIDTYNEGRKAYRLLGCELEFEGGLPKPGDVLKFKISIDDHLVNGDVRLFLFHYDCYINGERRIKVRNAQAGFFSREELDHSDGCLWDPHEAGYSTTPINLNPDIMTQKRSFPPRDIQAYLAGDMVACFGDNFYLTQTHTRTPQTPEGMLNFISNVKLFDPLGGPSKRGYLKSVTKISEDIWFFDGHFKNDPCMPGTLMADACLQMISFYMVALGLTQEKDGWRFEPVSNSVFKLICRGQVIPESKELTYEIFIDEVIQEREPIIFAHVLCTVDGLKAFSCERMGVKLVPDWPMSSHPEMLTKQSDRAAFLIDNFPFDYNSLLNAAIGKPSDSFGPELKHMDGPINTSKLPGPPYHFMTRIVDLQAERGNAANRPMVATEYDIPENAWYFMENGRKTMPYCVLMEIALQPCGWLSSYTLSESSLKKGLLYRNLDGDAAVQYRDVIDEGKTVRTTSTLISCSQAGELIIEKFRVESRINDELVYSFETAFGFFSKKAMKNQKGLPVSEQEHLNINLESNVNIDLLSYPYKYFRRSTARLPASKLLMIDRITCFLPHEGAHKLGYVRAEKDVVSKDWFFKAHFYQDPVQPGSLGVEGLIQLLQWYMLEDGFHLPFENPVFEPVLLGEETTWRYRGQVLPSNKLICMDLDITEINDKRDTVFAHANLWVDSLKIYNLPRIGMKIRESQAFRPEQGRVPAGQWLKPHAINSGLEDGLILDVTGAFLEEFTEDLIFENKSDFDSFSGPALYLANHQTAVESYLALAVIYAFKGGRLSAISKQENRDLWLGKLLDLGNRLLKNNPLNIIYFNREKPEEFISIYKDYLNSAKDTHHSLLVHVAGTREKKEGVHLKKMSSVLLDIALDYDIPIIPLRFTNGLPKESHSKKFDFPYNQQKQAFIFGKQLNLTEMKTLRPQQRSTVFLNILNNLTLLTSDNPYFSSRQTKHTHVKMENLSHFGQMVIHSLSNFPNLSEEGQKFLDFCSQKPVDPQLKTRFQQILTSLK